LACGCVSSWCRRASVAARNNPEVKQALIKSMEATEAQLSGPSQLVFDPDFKFRRGRGRGPWGGGIGRIPCTASGAS
jgi:hypothetical protein